MRIISGKFKGRKFNFPKGLPVRPTTDFVKENLFNILNNKIDIEDCNILDLFAGSGNISFEFISRGAKSCTAVDLNRKCIDFIKSLSIELKTDLKITMANALSYITKPNEMKFDIIFADPPYALNEISQIPYLIFDNNLLAENGLLIIESGINVDYSSHPNFQEIRKYGQSQLTLFQNHG